MIPRTVDEAWLELQRQADALASAWRDLSGPTRAGVYRRPGPRGLEGAGVDERAARLQRLRRALRDSEPTARELLLARFEGLELASICGALLQAAQDIALLYVASSGLGGVVGGLAGAFAGGVGALPGAAVGAAAGAQVATWILAFLGLQALLEDLGSVLPEALGCYRRGFVLAWGPTQPALRRYPVEGFDPDRALDRTAAASRELAQGHVILVSALLGAMAAYLMRGGANRAALLTELRASRLGPRVADWLEKHGEDLARHPRTRPRRADTGGTDGASPPPPAAPPRRPRDDGKPEPPRMPPKRVPCFNADHLPPGKLSEFERQLAGQEAGLNELTVEEYLQGRQAFKAGEVARDTGVARRARAEFEQKLAKDLSDRLQAEGMSPGTAKLEAAKQAAEKMRTLAALHQPDLVAAGRDTIGGFGDRQVNSSIGSQWRSRIQSLDEAADKISAAERGSTRMNAKLERCR